METVLARWFPHLFTDKKDNTYIRGHARFPTPGFNKCGKIKGKIKERCDVGSMFSRGYIVHGRKGTWLVEPAAKNVRAPRNRRLASHGNLRACIPTHRRES